MPDLNWMDLIGGLGSQAGGYFNEKQGMDASPIGTPMAAPVGDAVKAILEAMQSEGVDVRLQDYFGEDLPQAMEPSFFSTIQAAAQQTPDAGQRSQIGDMASQYLLGAGGQGRPGQPDTGVPAEQTALAQFARKQALEQAMAQAMAGGQGPGPGPTPGPTPMPTQVPTPGQQPGAIDLLRQKKKEQELALQAINNG
jgi:hypothetical protein